MILDDFDARPGSATSLLRTIVGVCLRRVGGWISIADLIRLMEAVGVTPAHTRTAVSRVKAKGLLLASTVDGQPGYALNPDAVPMLERGDRRIFTFRQMADGDPWCLLSFSIPEAQRDVRHQLRKRLGWIGCGTVATGLWICPAFLADEVEEIVADLGLRDHVTVFIAGTPHITGTLADAARRWWDLDHLENLHRGFLASQAEPPDPPESPESAPEEIALRESVPERPRASFARFIRALDQWRILPYLDPGLPPSALPDDWPGFASVALFERITATHAARAYEFLHGVTR
jgi:phenylacetic acid degradation operon negative regulatory protein